MRKTILNLWLGTLYLLIALGMGGCEESAGDKDKVEENWVLTLSLQSIVLPADAGSQAVAVATNYDDWRVNINSGDTWCHAERGKNEVVIQLDPNKSSESRKTVVRVSVGEEKSSINKEIEVLQLGAQLSISLDPEALAFAVNGGTQHVNVLADGQKWGFGVMAGEEWCHVAPFGNTLIVTADPNIGESMREALVVVNLEDVSSKGEPVQATLKVQQEGSKPTLEVSENVLSFASGAEVRTLVVMTNQPKWEMSSEKLDWCSFEQDGDKLRVSVTPNTQNGSRRATLRIVAGELGREVTIVQAGVEPQLEVTPATLEFPSEGSVQAVAVLTNLGTWKARSANPEWCEAVPGNRTLNVMVGSYDGKERRQTTITIEAGEGTAKKQATIHVYQAGANTPAPGISIVGTWLLSSDGIQSSYTFSDKGKVCILDVSEGNVSVDNYSYVLSDHRIMIDNIEVCSILSMDSLTMTWSVGGQEELSFDRVAMPVLTLSKQQAELGGKNSTDEVSVTSNVVWGTEDRPDWLSINPSGGRGNGKLTLTATAEPAGQPRQATLTFYAGDKQKTLTVIQKAAEAPVLAIDPASLQAGAGESTQVVKVSSNTLWNVSNVPSWITVKPMSGNGNGNVSLTIAANGKSQPREAKLLVAIDGKEVELKVSQEALAETLEVDQSNFDITAAGSEETIRLTCNSDWEFTNVPDWIVFSPSKGQQNGTIKMAVAANAGENSRSARISIKSGSKNQTLLVNQVAVKYYEIPLRLTGDALGCGQAVGGKHLFAIQVMSRVKNGTGAYQPYGYGLFDDSASIRVNLPDVYEYKICATLILDGKNRIARNGGFATPVANGLFTGTGGVLPTNLENRLTLDNSRGFIGIAKGMTQLMDGKTYDRPDVKRYYGEIADWNPTSNGAKAINMKSVVFGLACEVTGMPRGGIRIELDGAPAFRFGQSDGYKGEKIFSFGNFSGGWMGDNYSETCGVRVVLEDTDGTARTLHYEKVKFIRGQSSKLTAKYNKGGYSFTWETEGMSDKNLGDFNGNVWW